MGKTLDALDSMGERLLTQVWGYATSGKLWITVGAMYVGYTQGGTEGALAAIGMGGVFVAAKTYQNSKVIQAKANGQATLPKPTVPKPEVAPKIFIPDVGVSQYEFDDPVDPKLYGASAPNAFLSYEQYEDIFTTMDLNYFAPSVRYIYAKQLVKEAGVRLEAAWEEAFKNAGASATPSIPQRDELTVGMRLTEDAETRLEAVLPKTCGWLSQKVYNITSLSIAIGKWYKLSDNLTQLDGLEIDWTKARTLSEIERRGLAVVANRPQLKVEVR